jgi:hypothetical protein
MGSRLEVGLLLSREAGERRRAGHGTGAPPAEASLPAQSSSPAVMCIIVARLAWIAPLMISSV